MKALIVPAPIDRQAAFERIAVAAVVWVYDQGCSGALADLEEAVCDFMGREIDGVPRGGEGHGDQV